jgi:hypothetical protein
MMPAWMVWGLMALNVMQMLGWGWTINQSMKRALRLYEQGRQDGVEQGLHRGRAEGKPKRWVKRRRVR